MASGELDPLMRAAAIELSRRLDDCYLRKLKLACSGTGMTEDVIQTITQFSDLFFRLKSTLSSPDRAVVFCCQVLKQLGYNATEYFMETASATLSGSFDYRTSYPKVDCMLSVLGFLDNLTTDDFSIARSVVCDKTKQSPDRVQYRTDLVNVLFNERLVSEEDLTYVLQLAKQFNRGKMFDEYLERHQEHHRMRGELVWPLHREEKPTHHFFFWNAERVGLDSFSLGTVTKNLVPGKKCPGGQNITIKICPRSKNQ